MTKVIAQNSELWTMRKIQSLVGLETKILKKQLMNIQSKVTDFESRYKICVFLLLETRHPKKMPSSRESSSIKSTHCLKLSVVNPSNAISSSDMAILRTPAASPFLMQAI